MAMRKGIARELKMLREICRDLLPAMKCCFCHKPLIADDPAYRFGDRNAKPIPDKLTGHHKDHDHSNNEKANRKWAHSECHRHYHSTYSSWGMNVPKRLRGLD